MQPGGCSGLRYQLYFDDRELEGDIFREVPAGEERELPLVVDRLSVPYVNCSTIDYVGTIAAQGFTIDNPNAAGTCACGDSFH